MSTRCYLGERQTTSEAGRSFGRRLLLRTALPQLLCLRLDALGDCCQGVLHVCQWAAVSVVAA
eukprot:943665-Rhodomonas_salina.2